MTYDGHIDLNDENGVAYADDELRILSHCFQILELSPTACSLMDQAALGNWVVSLTDLDDAQDYHLDIPNRTILINMDGLSYAAIARSKYFQTYILSVLVRSLRDAQQEFVCGDFDSRYAPEDILFLLRARAADLAVINALVAYELRTQGDSGLWRHIIGSEDGDIAFALNEKLASDDTDRNTALMAGFTQWYANSERVDAADHDALGFMDMVIEEEREEFGTHNPFGTARMDTAALIVVSCLHDRTAYLDGMAGDVLRDPYYAGLSDEVNQTHFLQITRDIETITVNNVPFRSESLAARIFPDGYISDEL